MTQGGSRSASGAATSVSSAAAVSSTLAMGAALAYLALAALVTTARTRGVDSSVYWFFRPGGVWGRTQRINADLVDGLEPRVVFSTLAVVAVLFAVRRRSWRPLTVVAVLSAVTALITIVTKVVVQRADTGGAFGVGGGSFPSGHAAAITVCIFGLLMLFRVRIRLWEWAVLLLVAMVVTVPLLFVGLHWLTDVVGGILVGLAVSSALSSILLLRPRPGVRPGSPRDSQDSR